MSINLSFVVIFAVFAALVASAQAQNSTCGGNCPGSCPKCVCGSAPLFVNATAICAQPAWNAKQQSCAVCLMKRLSNANANAFTYNEYKDSNYRVGLLKIPETFWTKCSGGVAPCDPSINMWCAVMFFQTHGNSFKPFPESNNCKYCWDS